MKKRILAVVMALTMAVAFMPVMSFAAYDNSKDGADQAAQDADQYIKDYQTEAVEAVAELVEGLDLEYIDGQIDFWQEYLMTIAKLVQAGNAEGLAEQAAVLDEYIKVANNFLKDYAYSEETQKCLQDFIAKAEDLKALLEENGIDVPENQDEWQALIDEATAALNEAIAALQEALQGDVQAQLEELIAEAIENAKAWAEEEGLMDALDEFLAEAEWFQDLQDLYEALGSPESLDELVEAAQQMLEDNADVIQEAVEALVADAIAQAQDMWNNGEFDEYIESLGTTRADVEAIVTEILNYAMGLANGETYTDLMEQRDALEAEVDDLSAALMDLMEEYRLLQAANEQLQNDNAALQADVDEFNALWANAMKLKKAKPAIKKPKAKKKKVTVKWKKFTKAEATGYQISWKDGKKTKMKKVKGAAKVKAVTKKIKKIKKGKKTTVKVRAYYTMKYAGKSHTFYSKWSKAKKVKVK